MQQKETICIAIVKNEQQQFLITRRQAGQHLAGKWEFPGGKLEEGESLVNAMQRELKEEVGLTATEYSFFEAMTFDYDELTLQLNFYIVSAFEGEASGLEGQMMKWVTLEELRSYSFPKANKAIIDKLG